MKCGEGVIIFFDALMQKQKLLMSIIKARGSRISNMYDIPMSHMEITLCPPTYRSPIFKKLAPIIPFFSDIIASMAIRAFSPVVTFPTTVHLRQHTI